MYDHAFPKYHLYWSGLFLDAGEIVWLFKCQWSDAVEEREYSWCLRNHDNTVQKIDNCMGL